MQNGEQKKDISMSKTKNETGKITWVDLTVKNAPEIKEFYSKVVGWKSAPVDMGDYNDFSMNLPAGDETVAGICHARDTNADLPPQWLIYITVNNVDESAEHCLQLGGKVISGPKEMGQYGRVCIIQDPAGAVAALFEPAQD